MVECAPNDKSELDKSGAAKHDVYNRLFQLDMTADYGIAPADAYDAVISVGVFGFGPPHVPHLNHIIGAAKPVAPVMFTENIVPINTIRLALFIQRSASVMR